MFPWSKAQKSVFMLGNLLRTPCKQEIKQPKPDADREERLPQSASEDRSSSCQHSQAQSDEQFLVLPRADMQDADTLLSAVERLHQAVTLADSISSRPQWKSLGGGRGYAGLPSTQLVGTTPSSRFSYRERPGQVGRVLLCRRLRPEAVRRCSRSKKP